MLDRDGNRYGADMGALKIWHVLIALICLAVVALAVYGLIALIKRASRRQ